MTQLLKFITTVLPKAAYEKNSLLEQSSRELSYVYNYLKYDNGLKTTGSTIIKSPCTDQSKCRFFLVTEFECYLKSLYL